MLFNYFNKICQYSNKKIVLGFLLLLTLAAIGLAVYYYRNTQVLTTTDLNLQKAIAEMNKELNTLKNTDQIKINQNLTDVIKNINTSYKNSISAYEKIVDLKAQKMDTSKIDPIYAAIVNLLADLNLQMSLNSDKKVHEVLLPIKEIWFI